VRVWGATWWGQAGLGCESESGAEEEDEPDRQARLSARAGEGRRGRARGFWPGALSWAQKREGEARGKTGRVGKEEEKGARPVGPCGRSKREG
jgi:hypothetical protein